MTERTQYIIEQVKTRTLQSVADELGLSRQRIQQITKKNNIALGRHNSRWYLHIRPPRPPVLRLKRKLWFDNPVVLKLLAICINHIGMGNTKKRFKFSNPLLIACFAKYGFVYKDKARGPRKQDRAWVIIPKEYNNVP